MGQGELIKIKGEGLARYSQSETNNSQWNKRVLNSLSQRSKNTST